MTSFMTETNQLSGRGLVLVPGCAVHILGSWLILDYVAS